MIFEESYTLHNGVVIPKLALGTWFIDDDKAAEAVQAAVKKITNKDPFKGINPDECVAIGAAIQGGVLLLAACFLSGYFLTTHYQRITGVMFVVFALVGLAWAAINVNSLPMVVEMCKGSDIGKFTGYYYTFSMAAQVVTPILAGTLLKHISYSVLFPYASFFVACSFVTMCFVRHGDCKVEAKGGLAAYEDMDAD